MSDELLPCPFCGKDCHKTTLCMHNETLVECNNQKCALFGRVMKSSTWNTRPDSKPYKYTNEDEWQEAKGWYTSEFQEAITFAFNAAREKQE